MCECGGCKDVCSSTHVIKWCSNSMDVLLSLLWIGSGGLQLGCEGRKCAEARVDDLRGCGGESCLAYSCSTQG